jgi:hypothetical protein
MFDHEGVNRAVALAPALEDLARRVRPVMLARDRRMAVGPPLDAVLPEGLARGIVVAVGSRPGVAGITSLALTLVARASQDGAWVAVVGAPWLGLVAAAELGVVLDRLVVVDVDGGGRSLTGNVCQPTTRGQRRPRAQLASVVAALVDGFDVVVVGPAVGRRLRQADTRRLAARTRERGGVLVAMGQDLPGGAASVRLEVVASAWEGLEEGGGRHLRACRATVEATGRGAASRTRRAELVLRGVGER